MARIGVGVTGRTLSHYRVLEKLGEGGMGVVYRAVDTKLDRALALKILPPEAVREQERKKRFVQEARSASALNHPHIVTIYDIDSVEGVDFIAMELVSGRTLHRLIAPRKGLPLQEALKYAVQMADALAAAHEAGILHRDLKPANVMVNDRGMVKILDFGLAKLLERRPGEASEALTEGMNQEGAPRTDEGVLLGTVAYMSPEQAEGKTLDARSDIFSFGSVLYEMLSGRRAFPGESSLLTLTAIARDEPEPVGSLVKVPAELARIVTRCLRKDPSRRFQTMADLKVALEELKEESDSGKLTSPLRATIKKDRTRWVLATVAAVVVTAGLILGAGLWRPTFLRRPETPPPHALTQLTWDSGVTDEPAISPDGKLLAYVSDRASAENFDIFVQQIPAGQPLRLTHDPADDLEPSFSPDGSKIVFASSRRDSPGTYVIPTLGGEERLLAKGDNRAPRFSPDGKWISYLNLKDRAAIQLLSMTGESARRLETHLSFVLPPVWLDEGRLLFRTLDESGGDWYVIGLDGDPPVPTGASAILPRYSLGHLPLPWSAQGYRVLFGAEVGDSRNLWQISISPETWKVEGAPERVTSGTTEDANPSVTPQGRLVYASRTADSEIGILPLDANGAQVLGEMTRVEFTGAEVHGPSISADGRTLAFSSRRAGSWDVFVKDLETGRETALTETPGDEQHPLIFADRNVAYSARENDRWHIFVVSVGGGQPESVCDDCGDLRGLSPDGKQIFYGTGTGLGVVNVETHEKREWLERVVRVSFTPDGAWVAVGFGGGGIRVARANAETPPREEDFVADLPGDFPLWSPDGNTLYFEDEPDGVTTVMAQHLDPTTKKPNGPALPIYDFRLKRLDAADGHLALTGDKMVMDWQERKSNIWMTELGRRE